MSPRKAKAVSAPAETLQRCKTSRNLLYGPPGTGKSTAALQLAKETNRPIYSITLNQDMSPSALLGFWGLMGGNTIFIDGPAVKALEEGGILLIDEIHDCPPSCETTLMSLLNDRDLLAVPLADGRTITAAEGFTVVATTNGNPQDLRAALLDRFELVLEVLSPCDEALEKLGRENSAMARYIRDWYDHSAVSIGFSRPVSFRALLAMSEIARNIGDEKQAARLVFGDNWSDVFNAIQLQAAKGDL